MRLSINHAIALNRSQQTRCSARHVCSSRMQGLKTAGEEGRAEYEQLAAQLPREHPGHLPLLQERLTRLTKAEVRCQCSRLRTCIG